MARLATGGAKELFRYGPAGSERICITEAAIDAMNSPRSRSCAPTPFMSALAAAGPRRRMKLSATSPIAPTPGLWQQPTIIGRVTSC